MKCVICRHGDTRPGYATVMLQRGATTVIIKETPADVCATCGEYYLSESIAARVASIAEEAVKKGAEVEILRFAA
ncbi:MAG TPA: type II toxin-antitoxin system MqsA family antitoxin [Candidatus Brocadiia bacterium]|nr:type II toxin-antitoxin system MqsA family antitoxin [Candidatus Brocadiia bacterium]